MEKIENTAECAKCGHFEAVEDMIMTIENLLICEACETKRTTHA